MVDYQGNIEVILGDKDFALLLLNSLPKGYENFKDTMIYEKQTSITLYEIMSFCKTKELRKNQEKKEETS